MDNRNQISSLHLIGSKNSGGAERFFCRLVNALYENGDPVISGMPVGSVLANELLPGVENHLLKMRSVFDPVSRWELSKLVKAARPDIVQTYMGRATRLLRLSGVNRPLHVARLGGYYNLKGYRHADAWVGNTRGICDYLVAEGLPKDRVFHISNFIEPPVRIKQEKLEGFLAQCSVPTGSKVISALGRLHPNKGFSDLLTAFSMLPETIDKQPVVLLIAGSGPLEKALKNQAKTLGIDDKVRWLGWLSPPDVLYQSSDVFVCPSVHEPLGNVILEAWAQQVPVVSTKTDGALELMKDGVNGLLADVSDAGQMCDQLLFLLDSDQSYRSSLVEQGAGELVSKYSRQVIIDQYQKMYRQLINEK